jgi:cyclopropane-fatty-acyl-phospholipid synthase
MSQLKPFYERVQAHYDLSDAFFKLFLDPSMTYSCAYFERDGMTLAEAQRAKIDLALGKLDLRPGMRLLDIGCGWGATLRRAVEHWSARAVGLTLSRNQHAHVQRALADLPDGSAEVRLRGWEQFDEPVDRIVSIGAFEHFRVERYAAFFQRCRDLLPPDGRMLLHTIVRPDGATLAQRGIRVAHDDVLFAKFISRSIFPGGQLAPPQVIARHAESAGFVVERIHSLRPHYARTLDAWAAALETSHAPAVAVTSQDVYDTYMRYLTGCAHYFRSGHIDVIQFTLTNRSD